MKILLDFAVWTLGLAIALPIYLQKEFFPRELDLVYWLVIVAMSLSAISLVFGVVFRAHATKTLAGDPDTTLGPDAKEKYPYLWKGAAHSWILGAALMLTFSLFVYEKVLPPSSREDCRSTLLIGGNKFDVIYECGASLKAIFQDSNVVKNQP